MHATQEHLLALQLRGLPVEELSGESVNLLRVMVAIRLARAARLTYLLQLMELVHLESVLLRLGVRSARNVMILRRITVVCTQNGLDRRHLLWLLLCWLHDALSRWVLLDVAAVQSLLEAELVLLLGGEGRLLRARLGGSVGSTLWVQRRQEGGVECLELLVVALELLVQLAFLVL